MLRLRAPSIRLCDGWRRRDFLLAGTAAACAGIVQSTGAAAPQSVSFGRAKRCLLLFLTGGPPQHDTWDMKPSAPAEIRGELQPIDSTVPGLQISELFPKLARQAHQYCVMRSVTHHDTVHTSAGYTMLTGVPHPLANAQTAQLIQPSASDHPHVASMVSAARSRRDAVPTFMSLPEIIKDDAVNEYPGQHPGFLGAKYGPFRVETNSDRCRFVRPEIVLPTEITLDRLRDRWFLRQQLEGQLAATDQSVPRRWDDFASQAQGLLRSAALRDAFELDREPQHVRDAYGAHLFGQGTLLARRLLEAGVTFVTVYWHYEGPRDSPVWDTHWNNYRHLRERLMAPTDAAVSAVLADLADRGLLDETLVLCLGEFGRTPRLNKFAGRDHWPHVQSILLAGAGIPGGSVYGQSDAQGAYPVSKPVSPADLIATILHLLGVSPDLELHDQTGRPVRGCTGTPIAQFCS